MIIIWMNDLMTLLLRRLRILLATAGSYGEDNGNLHVLEMEKPSGDGLARNGEELAGCGVPCGTKIPWSCAER